ncbi:MAG: hypothetical protein L3K16_02315 [Thermoplasmata archaeon]|nr:hypothetical protein [Thermoplasmata archaeon]
MRALPPSVALGVVAIVVALAAVPVAGVGGLSPAHPPVRTLPSLRTFARDAVADSVAGRPLLDPASGGASTRMLVTTADPGVVPNNGIATNLTAFPALTYPANSSFQTGAEEVIGSYEAVFGIFTNTHMDPTAFFAVFSNSSDVEVQILYWVGLPISSGYPYNFQLVDTTGTTWTLTVNGLLFGNESDASFDFGASTATWSGGIGFSELAIYDSTTTVPTSFVATTALAVDRPGAGWYLPVNGTANYSGPSAAAYGIQGRTQLAGFAPGEVASGTSLAAVRSSETLWTTGPVPVEVGVNLSARTAPGLGFVNVEVNVSTPSATPLGTVPVYIGDSLGGNATPSTVYTELDGAAGTILTLPNESVAVGLTVRATVTILGFVGSNSTALTIEPSVQVIVTSSAPNLTLPPGTNGTESFETHTNTGQPFPGVALALSATVVVAGSAGSVSVLPDPSSGTTDGNGTLTVRMQAPSVAGDYAVVAVVSDYGVWGQTTVHVTVRTPPPTFWQSYGTREIVPAIGVGAGIVVVVALVVAVRRRRGPRQGLPEMDLRKLREQGGDSGPGAAPSVPPVSRTPPGSDTP